jgi:hypothetical protein
LFLQILHEEIEESRQARIPNAFSFATYMLVLYGILSSLNLLVPAVAQVPIDHVGQIPFGQKHFDWLNADLCLLG